MRYYQVVDERSGSDPPNFRVASPLGCYGIRATAGSVGRDAADKSNELLRIGLTAQILMDNSRAGLTLRCNTCGCEGRPAAKSIVGRRRRPDQWV